MKTTKWLVAAIGAASLGWAVPALAQTAVLGTEPEGDGGFGVGFSFDPDTNLVIGQAFTLTEPIDLTGITVFVNGNENSSDQGTFTLTLTNLIGPSADDDNVLFSSSATFPSTLGGNHEPVVFDVPLTLQAGSYYIVLNSDASGSGWGNGAALLDSDVGTVDDSYVGFVVGDGVGDYRTLNPDDPNTSTHANFQLLVPEPTVVTLAVPLLLLLRRRSRRLD